MKSFAMSMFASEKDLYKAKAEHWEKRFKWLAEQHWVEPEATFRCSLPDTDDSDEYMFELLDYIDSELD